MVFMLRGLRTMIERLSNDHEVYVVAPSVEQSAKKSFHNDAPSHYGLRTSTYMKMLRLLMRLAERRLTVLRLHLKKLIGELPDLVISGINDGPNLGNDIIYSGTVAGSYRRQLLRCQLCRSLIMW